MYLVSYNHTPINTEDLHEPSKRHMSFINTACIEHYKEYKSLEKIHWFIKKKKKEDPKTATTIGFAGIATKLSDNPNGFNVPSAPYAICISSFVFKECVEYILWLIRHELRHCKPTGKKFFRFHDIEFVDEGWKAKVTSGFFNEDFAAVACCDILMNMFQNLKGIEEYLG